MWHEIATWQETLKERPDLAAKTVALYTQDVRRFATWVQHEHPGLKVTEVTPTDAKAYRDYLLAKRYAPTNDKQAAPCRDLHIGNLEGCHLRYPWTCIAEQGCQCQC